MAILSSQDVGDVFNATANVQKMPPISYEYTRGDIYNKLLAATEKVTPSQNDPTVTVTDPVLASALAKLAGQPVPGTAAAIPPADKEGPSYQFIAGWVLLIVILAAAAQTRIGYVLIYYSLMLMILLILLTEYSQITPILDSIQTIGMFNSNAKKSVA